MKNSSNPVEYEHLSLTKQGNNAWIRLSRPSVANALSREHLAEIEHVSLSMRDEPDIRVVIFHGAGKHFSGGADLNEQPLAEPVPMVQKRRSARMGERAIEAILGIDQITIAAWHGAAMGGGACITTACDFRIGTPSAVMQYPEINLGINLMWKSLPLIIALVGPARAKRLVAGGELLDAQTLLSWGILDELVPEDELLDAARRMADLYASKPPIAAQMIKQSTNQLAYAMGSAIMHMDVDQNLLTVASDDRAAAIQAYQHKTQGTYNGD